MTLLLSTAYNSSMVVPFPMGILTTGGTSYIPIPTSLFDTHF